MLEFIKDFFAFARQNKRYWLLPMLFVLALLGALIFLSAGSPVAPFVYTLF